MTDNSAPEMEARQDQGIGTGLSVPVGWSVALLDDFIAPDSPICYGILMPGRQFPGGIPVVEIKDFSDGEIVSSNLRRVDPAIEASFSRSRLKAGDLLVGIRGSVGDVALVPDDLSGANITRDPARLRAKSSLDRQFLLHALRSALVQDQIKLETIGQAVRGINIAHLRRLKIPNPPNFEKLAISKLLDAADTEIREVRVLQRKYGDLKRGFMQRLLTGKARHQKFRHLEWQHVHLGELFSERNETKRGDLPLLSITADRGLIRREEVDRKDSSNEDKSLYKRIVPGDIGYNSMRMWQGVSTLSTLEGIVSPAYTVCIPNGRIDAQFAAYLFKFPPIINLFYRYSQGLVDDTLSLKFQNFAEIKVEVPQVPEQIWIASILSKTGAELQLLRGYSEFLRIRRKALIDKLMRGQIRFKEPHNV